MYVIFAGELFRTPFLYSCMTKKVLFSSITPCFKEYEKICTNCNCVYKYNYTTLKFQWAKTGKNS